MLIFNKTYIFKAIFDMVELSLNFPRVITKRTIQIIKSSKDQSLSEILTRRFHLGMTFRRDTGCTCFR